MLATATEIPVADDDGAVVLVDAAQLETWTTAMVEPPAPIRTAAIIATLAPWALTVTPLAQPPRMFSAYRGTAVESRDHGDAVELQVFPRARLTERISAQLTEHEAAEPGRVRRPGRIAPLLIDALVDQDGQFSDDDLRSVLTAAPEALLTALPHVDDARLLERSVPGHEFPHARLLVLSCGEHGRWALWDSLDAREPWNIGKARIQRVDDPCLLQLIRTLTADLTVPEPTEDHR